MLGRFAVRGYGWALLAGLGAVLLLGEVGLAGADDGGGGFFGDVGGVHQPGVNALAGEGIIEGTECGEGLLCPGEPFRRWVMGVWVIRALGETPSTVPSRFEDVDNSLWWAPYVERLAELGITLGCSSDPVLFCPGEAVTRAQMATFLVRAFNLPSDDGSWVRWVRFADVGRTAHAGNIDALANAGITAGCAIDPVRFCPSRKVTRAQMATFLARALGLIPKPTPTIMVEAPDIRAADVRMGIYPCCADLAYWQIPIELGWWDELNITITPNQPTYHYFTAFQEIIPWLILGDGDVAQAWVPGVFQSLETFGQDIPPIHFSDIYVGYAILVAPDSDAKTALEFMDEGMSFSEAATAAVQQLVGKPIHIPPHSTTQAQYSDAFFAYLPQWWEDVVGDFPALDGEGNQLVLLKRDGTPVLDEFGNEQPIRITTNDWRNYATPVYVDDPTIVQLSAVPGRIRFAMPYGAPTLVQMMRNGWDPLINFAMMYEHDAASQQTAIASATSVGGTGLLARREWVEENKDLAYRVVSVANRALAFLEDPDTQYQGWEIEANIINERRLLSMEPEDIGIIWDTIDPSFNWEDQEALWDLSLPSYHPETAFATQIEALKANGILSSKFNTQAELEEFLLAKELYYDLKDMQERSDDLFARAGSMSLSESRQALVDQAQVFYDRYNFYDALRYLEAALIGYS